MSKEIVTVILAVVAVLAGLTPWAVRYFKTGPGEDAKNDEPLVMPRGSDKFVEAMEEANRRAAAARAKKYEEYDYFVRLFEEDFAILSVQIDGKLMTEEVRGYIETRLKVASKLVEMRKLRDQYGPMRRPPMFLTERINRA